MLRTRDFGRAGHQNMVRAQIIFVPLKVLPLDSLEF